MSYGNMKSFLETLKGKVVKINRGGPESRVGKLLAVKSDYVVLLTEEDGVVYYKTHHIKSITEDVRKGLKFKRKVPKHLDLEGENSFKDLLKDMKHKWVQINRGGPERVEGVIDEIMDDYVTLVSSDEVIRFAIFHINNFSNAVKKSDKDKDKDNDKDKGKDKS